MAVTQAIVLRIPLPEMLDGSIRRVLSPNGRAHYHKVGSVKQQVKMAAFYGTVEALGRRRPKVERATLSIDAAYRGAGRVDSDNIWAMCKAARDGIAAALKVDDHCFSLGTVTLREERKVQHFIVEVEIT